MVRLEHSLSPTIKSTPFLIVECFPPISEKKFADFRPRHDDFAQVPKKERRVRGPYLQLGAIDSSK